MKIFKIIIFIFYFQIISIASTINIAVAANVSYAIEELKNNFENNNPNIKLNIILGGSGSLTAKINHNAPYDLFMSANMLYPNNLYKNGYAINKPKIYAHGELALLTTHNINLSNGLLSLNNNLIKRIAIANPKTAPYGVSSLEALKNINILSQIKSKIIYGESISQTLSYTLKACDIGIVAKSLLFSPKLSYLKKNKNWVNINTQLYAPIDQGVVILKKAKDDKEVEKFYNFLFSNKAKRILIKYGYSTKIK